ncbi:hypothetical protein FOZ60_005447 [Perkinsus olseni]|uniref:Peptidase M16C associated domain-containing protein n=1 Tax=Perkinsus olseni TaxID=32597 RepID=A0A7J6NRU9_PEROL|nr:hypothetical protein FOZ60_005447 [Perkinsus olseni]
MIGVSRAAKRAHHRCLLAAVRRASSALPRAGLNLVRPTMAHEIATSAPCLGGCATYRRFSSGKNSPAEFEVGDHIHGFTVVQSSTVPDISARVFVLEHDQSGARLIALSNSDANKSFGAAFPTPPEDNSGVAHVLEHSVLCGSRSYPTKDPFATLLQSSHQTFLNALTYPDRTCYPVASCNSQDLYNLAEVYIDSLLHPKVVDDEYIIRQEGWRVQPGGAEGESPTLQGVVYNEMKGVYSSADMLHYRMISRALNPDNCYRFDSGGDPQYIPKELSQDRLVSFYKTHYHPGRAVFWFYGDGDVDEQAAWLSGKLAGYETPVEALEFDSKEKYMQPLRDLTGQPPHRVTFDYDPKMPDFDSKSQVSVSWLLNDERLTSDDRIRYAVFDSLMLGRTSSPLARKLLDSGLGKSLAIGSGTQDDLRQAIFSVGLKDEIRDAGVDSLDVQAAVNSVEFKLREFNTGRLPRGVAWFLTVAPESLYNGSNHDVSEVMRFEAPLRRLKNDLAAGKPVFEDIIDGVLKNKHRVTVVTSPEEGKGERLRQREKELMEEVRQEGGEELADQTKRMMAWQNSEDSPEDIGRIPMLRKADMPREENEIHSDESGDVLWHPEVRTQGLVYADAVFDATALSVEDQTRLPVVMKALTELGLQEGDSVQELHRRIETNTGGLAGGIVNVATTEGGRTAVVVRGRCLLEKTETLASLMADVVNSCDWFGNRQRLVEVVDQMCSSWEQSMLIGAGHQLALSAAYASLPAEGRVHDANRRDYAQSGGCHLCPGLSMIALHRPARTTGDLGGLLEGVWQSQDLLGRVSPLMISAKSLCIPGSFYGIAAPSVQIGYNSRALTVPEDTDVGTAIVAAQLVSMNYMWQQIRMQGGAYGASCQFNHRSKTFGMTTYRDPHVRRSLEIMRDAGKWLQNPSSLDPSTVDQAAVGVIGQLEIGHLMPDEVLRVSLTRWLAGESPEERQARRVGILEATREGVQQIGQRICETESSAEVCIANETVLTEAGISPLLPLIIAAAVGSELSNLRKDNDVGVLAGEDWIDLARLLEEDLRDQLERLDSDAESRDFAACRLHEIEEMELQAAVEELYLSHMATQGGVPCPLCSRGKLGLSRSDGLLWCENCLDMRIRLGRPGLSLEDDIAPSLHAAVRRHLEDGRCEQTPVFTIRDGRLVVTCELCRWKDEAF